jgi:hypothetical protein
VVGAAGGAATPAHRTRVGLQLGHQIGHRLERRVGGDGDHLVFARKPGDRGDVLKAHRRLVGEDGADHDQAADQDRIAAAPLAGHELGEPDGAAGAWNVDHLDARGEAAVL